MILIEIGVQDGLNEYNYWHYLEDYTEDDYDKEKITDREILSEFFYTNYTDEDYFDKDREQYWNDTSAVWVNGLREMTDQELETLKKLRIVY